MRARAPGGSKPSANEMAVSLNRFLCPYYILNTIALLSYLVVRRIADISPLHEWEILGFDRVCRIWLSAGFILFHPGSHCTVFLRSFKYAWHWPFRSH